MTYLLPCNEDWFIDDNPGDRFLAARNRDGSFVCHVELVIRDQIMDRNGFDRHILTYVSREGAKVEKTVQEMKERKKKSSQEE